MVFYWVWLSWVTVFLVGFLALTKQLRIHISRTALEVGDFCAKMLKDKLIGGYGWARYCVNPLLKLSMLFSTNWLARVLNIGFSVL